MSGETTQNGNDGENASNLPQTTIDCKTTVSAANSSMTGTLIQIFWYLQCSNTVS